MILDKTTEFSNAQAITASAASTNQIDIGARGTSYGASVAVRRDIGIGADNVIPITINVVEAFNNLTSLTVALQVDDDVSFGSPKTVATGEAIPLASLTNGYTFKFPATLMEGTDERYVRLFYTVAGVAPTLGKITAGVVAGRQTN